MTRVEGHRRNENHDIQRFLHEYGSMVVQPIRLLNGIGSYKYHTDPTELKDRKTALKQFLNGEPWCENVRWGKTIYAEVWAYILMMVAYPALFASCDSSLQLRLVPTGLDESKDFEQDPTLTAAEHQKGGDLLIYEITPGGNVPIVLFDVTLGNGSTIKNKRKHVPLQAPTETPVVVVGLNDLHVLPGNNHQQGNFAAFLDCSQSGVAQGQMAHGILQLETDSQWPSHLNTRLIESIDKTHELLQRTAYPLTGKIEAARLKLERARSLFEMRN